MDKFSLYEILSFLLPGYVLIAIFLLYRELVFNFDPISNSGLGWGGNILLLSIALFTGIILHVFTNWLVSKCKFLAKVIVPTVQNYSKKKNNTHKIIPFLNGEYKKLRKHYEEPAKPNEAESNLFDFAYYFLEVNDKISAAKNFQSLFYWFRNLFIISFFLLPISIIIIMIIAIGDFSAEQSDISFWIAAINLIMLAIIAPTARWLRGKTIEKILWAYYVERIHKSEN
jgi:hypothetical protein